jgi:hypothetical protein
VEISNLRGNGRGYLVLVNHSPAPQSVDLSAQVHALTRITPEGMQPLQSQNSHWHAELGAYEGAIWEWK